MVDADPQCNLTAYCLGLDSQKEVDLFYEKKENDDVYSSLAHILKPSIGDNSNVRAAKPTDTLHENLKLAAGSICINDLDIFCAVGLASDNRYNMHALKFVGLFNAMVRETALIHKLDIVLIDMIPSSGALSRSILMSIDYFIVPTYPDFFCFQAIEHLASQLPGWVKDFDKYREPSIPNCLPSGLPKMLGVICQRHKPHSNCTQDKVKAAQKWVDKTQDASATILAEAS